MAKEIIITPKSSNKKNVKITEYLLATMLRRILARSIDIILASIIPLALSLGLYLGHANVSFAAKAVIINAVNIVSLFTYFLVIPRIWDSKTLGKAFFRIKLVSSKFIKIPLKIIFFRELFITFLPLLVVIVLSTALEASFHLNYFRITSTTELTGNLYIISIVMRCLSAFVLAWYLGLLLVEGFDPQHQLFYDRKFKLFVVVIDSDLEKLKLNVVKPITREENHVHLEKNQPGNLDENALKEINDLDYND